MLRFRACDRDAGWTWGRFRRQCKVAYFVYIVKCADGTLYTGISTDVARRVAEHNAGTGAKYTRTRRPVCVVYVEEAGDRSAASRREFEIKRLSRKEKEALIASVPPPEIPRPAL